MRTMLCAALLAWSTAAYTAGGDGMLVADMRDLSAKMGEMQACMEKIDQRALEQLSARGESVADEVKSLCSRGQRDDAQKKAMAFAIEVRESPELAHIMKCGKIVSMQPTMPGQLNNYKNTDFENRHVCDMQ